MPQVGKTCDRYGEPLPDPPSREAPADPDAGWIYLLAFALLSFASGFAGGLAWAVAHG
jgi:hypothetical protein